jgi:MFS family permease
MPLELLYTAPHANLILGNHIAAFLTNAILFNIPLYFQGVLLTSATKSGLYLIIPSLVASATGTATGLLISRTRRLKWPLVLGSTTFLAGLVCLTALRRTWPAAFFLLALVPSSMGQGFQFPGTYMALLALWDRRRQAVVTSTLILWRSLGMVLGVAGSSLVVQNALLYYLERFVEVGGDGEEGKRRVIELVRSKVEAVRGLEGEVREQVVRSYEAALRLTFVCCAVLAVVNVLLIVPVRVPRLGTRK